MLPKKDLWSNKLNFILATTGAAVGLGNIWKFPYMAGANGGSAFFLIYLCCVLLIGIPLMIAEMLIGYIGKTDNVSCFQQLAKKHKSHCAWISFGWLGCFTLLLVLSFYSVVAGWSVFYIKAAAFNQFANTSAQNLHNMWQSLLSHPLTMLSCHSLFMFLTLFVVSKGIKQGLEKATKIMMPALFFILIILVGYASSKSGFNQGFNFLFHFDFSKINSNVAISALGHAFFTLAVGAGCIITYGSYLPKNPNIINTSCIIVALDILVAILSGLAIFPLIFTYNLIPDSGPGLMFQVLPLAFSKMGGGYYFGLLFFFLLFFAAWTSTISIAEPMVAFCLERLKYQRKKACWLVGFFAWLIGSIIIISFCYTEAISLILHKPLFDFIADLTTDLLLPLGGIGISLFVAYCIPKNVLYNNLKPENILIFNTWYYTIKYITPIGILIIFVFKGVL